MNAEVDRLKGAFLAIISHELRTPLTEIVAALDLLQDKSLGSLSPQQLQYLSIARDAANQLDSLINDLIAFAQLQAEVVQIHTEPASLEDIVHRVVSQLRPQASAKSLHLDLAMAPPLAAICVDTAMITRVISNLVINAINYTPPGGQVSVSIGTEPGFQIIQVKDSGVGIPKEKQPFLFESFYQASDHLTRQVGGLGIGLAYARRIVQAHGGRITFSSEEGKGSLFVVHLPSG